MQKRIVMTALVGLALFSVSIAAQGQGFEANADGAQQVPPNASTATATASLTLNAAQDALTYSITVVGLDLDGLQTPDVNDDVSNMHLHAAGVGENGPIRFGIIAPGDDADDIVIDPVAGTVTGIWEETDVLFFGGTLADYLGELQSEGLYLNIHTTAFPPGEIRGQIFGEPITDIPTLRQAGLALLVLLLVATGVAVLWRRKTA